MNTELLEKVREAYLENKGKITELEEKIPDSKDEEKEDLTDKLRIARRDTLDIFFDIVYDITIARVEEHLGDFSVNGDLKVPSTGIFSLEEQLFMNFGYLEGISPAEDKGTLSDLLTLNDGLKYTADFVMESVADYFKESKEHKEMVKISNRIKRRNRDFTEAKEKFDAIKQELATLDDGIVTIFPLYKELINLRKIRPTPEQEQTWQREINKIKEDIKIAYTERLSLYKTNQLKSRKIREKYEEMVQATSKYISTQNDLRLQREEYDRINAQYQQKVRALKTEGIESQKELKHWLAERIKSRNSEHGSTLRNIFGMMGKGDPFYQEHVSMMKHDTIKAVMNILEEHDALLAQADYEIFLFPMAGKSTAEIEHKHLYLPLFPTQLTTESVLDAAALLWVQRETKSQAQQVHDLDKKRKKEDAGMSDDEKNERKEHLKNRNPQELARLGYGTAHIKGEIRTAYGDQKITVRTKELREIFTRDYQKFMIHVVKGTRALDTANRQALTRVVSRTKLNRPYIPLPVYLEKDHDKMEVELIQSLRENGQSPEQDNKIAENIFYLGVLFHVKAEKVRDEKRREEAYQKAIRAYDNVLAREANSDIKRYTPFILYNKAQITKKHEDFELAAPALTGTLLGIFAQDKEREMRMPE